MVRYIVTGAAGHLGSSILRCLQENGQQVRGLILPTEKPVVEGAEYIRGDVREPDKLMPLFHREGSESLAVIHAAGIVDATGKSNPKLYDVNVNGTKNILALSCKYQVEKLVYVSSVHAIPEGNTLNLQRGITDFSPEKVVGDTQKAKRKRPRQCWRRQGREFPQ